MVIAIQKYIEGNLNTVDVVSISEKFNIDNNLLYHLDPNFKPGDYIKQKRKEKAIELIAKDCQSKRSLNQLDTQFPI